MNEPFPAWLVESSDGAAVGRVRSMSLEQLPRVDGPAVVIAVEYSSLNYKDALACRGHPGVVGSLPHVPGIDCAGRVVQSDSPDFQPGQEVLVTGYDLGAARWGGYSGLVRVPADWPVPLGKDLTPRQAMAYGTAGFTAAQCVSAIVDRVAPGAPGNLAGGQPAGGGVVVTGATGGVGVYAVGLLSRLGYRVTAVTGKPEQTDLLKELGADDVVGRDAVTDTSSKPMLAERWDAAVDTVGGATLATLLRSTRYRGVVAACGLVGGTDLPLTVYPFILRGVTLAGIDSAKCPREPRLEIWKRLSSDWRFELPESLLRTVTFDDLPDAVEQIMAGRVTGRTLVRPTTNQPAPSGP